MQTMREHILAIVSITKRYSQNHPDEPVYKHAVAMLNELDSSKAFGPGSIITGKMERVTHRLVHDPQESPVASEL